MKRSLMIEEFLNLAERKDLLWLLIKKKITIRYKRSFLGVLWSILHPFLVTLILVFVFSNLFEKSIQRYPVYTIAGLSVWHFFTQTVNQAMSVQVWGSGLADNIYVPRSVFAVSAVGANVANLIFALTALFIAMALLRYPLGPGWIALPVMMALVAMFTLGVALVMSILAVFFADVVEMFQVALSAWFFLTPIIYPVKILPAWCLRWIHLNPMVSMIEICRSPIYDGTLPDASVFLVACAWAWGSLLVGWYVFAKNTNRIAYHV